MPTAVESYAKLGAVLVYLPQTPTTHLTVDPNINPSEIGGRNSRAFHQPVHHGHVNPIANDDATTIGGRSGHSGAQAFHQAAQHTNSQIGCQTMAPSGSTTHATNFLLPAVQTNPMSSGQSHSYLIGLLLPAVHDISAALQKVLPSHQKSIEVIGIGTSPDVLSVLIGLLRAQGFHATIASCDGSVRPGFSGPTAVLRAHGSSVVGGLFLQQVASAHAGAPYGN